MPLSYHTLILPQVQCRGESVAVALGRQPDQWRPQWYLLFYFCFLLWEVCHVVSTTCNDRRQESINVMDSCRTGHCPIQLGTWGTL